MGADDPSPLQIDGVIRVQAGPGGVIRVSVLQAQLVPMAQRPSDVRRIAESFVVVILSILHVVKKESGAPLPVPLVSQIGVHAERAFMAKRLVAIQPRRVRREAAVRVEKKTAAAEKDCSAPVQPWELVVQQRNIAQFEVESGHT